MLYIPGFQIQVTTEQMDLVCSDITASAIDVSHLSIVPIFIKVM